MNAFDDVPLQQADANNKNLSPLAQATILAMKQSPGSSPYAVTVNTGVSSSYGQPPSPTYASPKKKSPKKSALAEAWGIAEPEPFEEFSAGRHSAYDTPPTGSHTSINNTATRTGMTTRADPFPEYSDCMCYLYALLISPVLITNSCSSSAARSPALACTPAAPADSTLPRVPRG